jgi:hypothetical protein
VAVAVEAEPPQQYWLDVARPIQPRPVNERRAPGRVPRSAMPPASPQMELRMPAPVPVAAVPAAAPAPPAIVGVVENPAPVSRDGPAPGPCFVAWLRDQGKKGGAIGELAKAARLDPRFPRTGSADDVRARFASAGADGDAFVALDDAERAYDRIACA